MRAFGSAYFNLLRRGADGSLTLSRDHWRLDAERTTTEAFCFEAADAAAADLVIDMKNVDRLVWDRLPRQQVRSQIRFHFANGDVWSFSGAVDESVLDGREGRT